MKDYGTASFCGVLGNLAFCTWIYDDRLPNKNFKIRKKKKRLKVASLDWLQDIKLVSESVAIENTEAYIILFQEFIFSRHGGKFVSALKQRNTKNPH